MFKIVLVEAFRENKAALASLKKLGFRRVESDVNDPSSSKHYKVVSPRNLENEEFDFDT